VSLGTDAAERWVGYESFENSMKKQFESTEEGKGTSRERVITVHKSGEVAWWSELWDWKGKAQGQPFALEGTRLTGVLEKRNGNWVIVQLHASVPVSGQAVKY
jgi:ketosteroid isomerase-like protein